MALPNSDPRYIRSREGLRRALVELAHEDPSGVTVSAVCERTGIDRATFYRHFNELDDLIADTIGDLVDRSAQQWKSMSRGTGDQLETSTAIMTDFCRHVVANWALYRWALGPGGSAKTIHEVLERQVSSSIDELGKLNPSMDEKDKALLSAYSGGGVLGAFLYWLKPEQPEVTPEVFAERTLKLVPIVVQESV